jgi:SAM-dependent methyltransferase
VSTIPFNPDQYKTEQRQGWDSVAAGWRTWWATLEQTAQVLSDRMIELAQISPGQRVLDIATGMGEPAITAARRVGPQGHVTAIDQAPQMLTIAQERAQALGLTNITFREVDAEQLDLPENSFDAVLCRFGLTYLPNLIPALDRIRCRLVSGGRLVATVWSTPPKSIGISLGVMVANQIIQAPPPPPGMPGPFSLADVDALKQKLVEAGFKAIQNETITVDFIFRSAEEFTQHQQDVASPLIAILAKQSPEKQAQIVREITEAARKYAAPDGSVRLPAEAICVVGQR